MTAKQTAIIRVARMVITALLTGALISLVLSYLTVDQLSIGLVLGVLGYMIHILYKIEVDRALRLEELNRKQS